MDITHLNIFKKVTKKKKKIKKMGKVLAAGIFIIREDKKLLICHPTNHAADFWSIPKGKIEAGETPLQAAIRETFEETNIDLNNYTLIGNLEMVNYNHKKKALFPFVCYEPCNKSIDFNSFDIKCNSNVPIERGGFPEMDDYQWRTLFEASKLLHNTQAECLDIVKRFIDAVDESCGKLDEIIWNK